MGYDQGKGLKMFDLKLEKTSDEQEFDGKIVINDLVERFYSNGEFYKIGDYQNQWLSACKRILESDESYFLTDVDDPKLAKYFFGWSLNKIDGNIFVQNMLFLSELFNMEDLLSMKAKMLPFLRYDEDGDKIPTWQISIYDIIAFKKRLEALIAA